MSGSYFYFSVLVPASVLLPIVTAVALYGNLDKPQKVIFFYLIFAGLIDEIASQMAFRHIANLWLLHVYTAVETVLLLWFYRLVLSDKVVGKGIVIAMILFPLLCAANIIWGQGIMRYNSYTRPLEALMLIFLGIAYFFESSRVASDVKTRAQRSLSWLNVGMVLYFSVAFFFFIFSNFLKQGTAFSYFILVCHATFVAIMYLFFTIGFLKCRN